MAIGLPNNGNPDKRERTKTYESRDLFETANLFPDDTGLPVTVWVSPRGNARHAARIKVCRVAGSHMVPSNTAVMAIAPAPRLIEGTLSPRYLEPVARWAAINSATLLRVLERGDRHRRAAARTASVRRTA